MKNPSKLSELKRATARTRAGILARVVDPDRPFARIPYRGRKYLVTRRSGGLVSTTYRCPAFVIREVAR